MEVRQLKIEIDGGIGTDGVYAVTWIGDHNDPAAEVVIPWDELIEKEIEFCTLVDRETIPYEDESDLHSNFDTIRTLREVANELEERLMACQAFDRQAWLQANKGDFYGPHTKEEFCKPMKEFFNDAG